MADKTTNIGLLKPTEQDYMQISVLNENMDTIDHELHRRGTTVNGITPDATGDYVVDEVPFAREIVSGASQPSHEEFILRTTGGHARLTDGNATLISIHGRSVHTGIVPESLTIEVDAATRQPDPETGEVPEDITAAIDHDTFVAYVNQSGTITLSYTDAWSVNPSLYGVTVTGDPVAGDQIIITYIKENRGTIYNATPTGFISTGWNLYNHSLGYARVLKYSNTYGFLVGGTYTDVEFSETLLGEKETISPVSGYFTIPSDGYIWITGGNSTDTYVLMTWSDWSEGYEGNFMPYSEDEIDLSGLFGTGNFFENGMMQVGGVSDEIDFDMGYAVSRIERIAYSAENLAMAEASGREYECDTNYIYIVREVDVRTEIGVSGTFSAYDHGMEFIDGSEIPVFVETLYGENLVEKLRTNVVTKSHDLVNGFTETGMGKALDARAGKTIDDSIVALADGLAILANGNTHGAVASGQFVYVRNHSTLAQGLYKANEAIAANATLTSSNLTADSNGGLNALNEQMATYDLGTDTIINIQSAIVSYASGLKDRDIKNIKFLISSASDPFVQTVYMGNLLKTNANRLNVEVYQAMSKINPVVGRYNSGTWEWQELATAEQMANIGKQIIDEIANTNIGSDGVDNWVDVKYIDVSAGTYYVQYSQFGSSTASNMVITIVANSATYALQSNAINSYNMGISVSAVVKMSSSGRITLRIKTSATMSNRERHIGCYRIST